MFLHGRPSRQGWGLSIFSHVEEMSNFTTPCFGSGRYYRDYCLLGRGGIESGRSLHVSEEQSHFCTLQYVASKWSVTTHRPLIATSEMTVPSKSLEREPPPVSHSSYSLCATAQLAQTIRAHCIWTSYNYRHRALRKMRSAPACKPIRSDPAIARRQNIV
jgi:hypothetical protein